MIYTAAFDGEVTLPADPHSSLSQYHDVAGVVHINGHIVHVPLPRDGFPRITAEGVKILIEGLRGDFTRWRWSIGNHPLEFPYEHIMNGRICAMKDQPHFVAHLWTGPRYPSTKRNRDMVPWYCFDEVDTNVSPSYPKELADTIRLTNSADHWMHAAILVGDAETTEAEDMDEDGMAVCPIVTRKAPEPAAASLDKWMVTE